MDVLFMLKIEPFSPDDFQQLIDWIPAASFALQWGDLHLLIH